MNRSILIVIVDFLLVSLLAFARFDEINLDESKAAAPMNVASVAGAAGTQHDVVDVLKLSLNKERESRDQLTEQLRESQSQLENRDQILGDRERLIREAEQLLRQKAAEAARLLQERTSLEQQYTSAQDKASVLQQQLSQSQEEINLTKRRFEEAQLDIKSREQDTATLERKLAELEKNQQEAEAQRQQLATQLQIAETETRLINQQLQSTKGEVQVERQEKAKLVEHATKLAEGVNSLAEKSGELSRGVTTLAEKSGEISKGVTTLAEKSGEISKGVTTLTEKSGELTKEIRENRPLAPNTIFNEFVTNRVRADFRAVRTGVFGREINREKESKTVLVRQGQQVYAIYHVNDTPLSLSFPGIDWDWLIGNLRHGTGVARVDRMSFLAVDPRVVVVPVSDAKARDLGSKIYSIPKDPFKFQDAIVVGASEGYYGECKFQLDSENQQYVRMQRERFSWLVGKFLPSSGDLVFTKGGELLGLMVNKDFCLLLTEFSPAFNIQMGIGISDQQTGQLLSQMYSQVARMPLKLQ